MEGVAFSVKRCVQTTRFSPGSETRLLGILTHLAFEQADKKHAHAQHERDAGDAHQTVVGGKEVM